MKRKRVDLVNQSAVRTSLSTGTRVTKNVTIGLETLNLIDKLVETGNGKYGSAFIEHACRFFIACLSGNRDNIAVSVEELSKFIVSSNFSSNLREYADLWDEGVEEIVF